MEKLEQIKNRLIEFNEKVGWNDLTPESANSLASLLIAEAVELWEETNKETKVGINKYDISLEVADVFIYLQKLCIALDIDLLESVEDKMLINQARFLNKDYRNKVVTPKPKPQRYYKIHNTYVQIDTKSNPITCGQILGIKTESNKIQQVYIIDSVEFKPEYMKKVVGIVYPRNKQDPIWVAADKNIEIEELDRLIRNVDFLYDVEII